MLVSQINYPLTNFANHTETFSHDAVRRYLAGEKLTPDLSQAPTEAARKVCSFRWKIEQLHRESKQVTGPEDCQFRKVRIQRKHIACALLVWVRLSELASQTKQNLYQLKQGLLDDYLTHQLRNPSLRMTLA